MSNDEPTLYIDDREKDEEMVRNAERVAEEMGVAVSHERLETGDYVYESGNGRRAAIEYKDVNDMAVSAVGDSPRIFKQANRVASEFEWGAVWVSGKVDELHTTHTEMSYGQMYAQIQEALSEIQSTMNIMVNWVHNKSLVADIGIRAMIRAGDRPPEEATKLLLSPGVAEDLRMSMIMGVTHFGRGDAKSMLEEFGTLRDAINAPFYRLMGMGGMGPAKARRWYSTSRAQWNGEPGLDVDEWDDPVLQFMETSGVGDHILLDVLEGTDDLNGDVESFLDVEYPDMYDSKREKIIEAAEEARE